MLTHRMPRPRARRAVIAASVLVPPVVLGVALGLYSIATAPRRVTSRSPLVAFDPEQTGRFEQRAWAAYYLRQWPQLFHLLLRLSRSQFGLSLTQAVYASYLATRAQVVWAREGERGGLAEAYMRRFYEFVRAPTGGEYDAGRAAELEIGWWAVHRRRGEYPDHRALAEALAATYAEVYRQPRDRMLAAAEARAQAMDLSDQWVSEGKSPESPLLEQIAGLLVASYWALTEAGDS